MYSQAEYNRETMKINTPFLALLLAAGLLAGCSSGGSTGPVTLRMKGSKGDKYTLASKMQMTADVSSLPNLAPGSPQAAQMEQMKQGEQSLDVNQTAEYELKEASPNKFTWQITNTDVKASGKGVLALAAPRMEASKGQVRTKSYDELGKPLDSTAEGQNDLFQLTFPKKPVKVGDVWEETVTKSGRSAKLSYKLEALEKVGSVDTAKISLKVDAGDAGKTDKPLLMWVDQATGQPVKAEGTISMVQNGLKLKVRIEMNRA